MSHAQEEARAAPTATSPIRVGSHTASSRANDIIAWSHGSAPSIGGGRGALFREGILPTEPNRGRTGEVSPPQSLPTLALGDGVGSAHLYNHYYRPPTEATRRWSTSRAVPSTAPGTGPGQAAAWRQPSDVLRGWHPMCTGGCVRRTNSTGSRLQFWTEDRPAEVPRRSMECAHVVLLRSAVCLPRGKAEACFAAQVRLRRPPGPPAGEVADRHWTFLGMALTPRAGEELRGIPVALLQFAPDRVATLGLEMWRVTEQDTVEHLRVLRAPCVVPSPSDAVSLRLVVRNGELDVYAADRLVHAAVAVPNVLLGEALPLLWSGGGRILVSHLGIAEGDRLPESRVYQAAPGPRAEGLRGGLEGEPPGSPRGTRRASPTASSPPGRRGGGRGRGAAAAHVDPAETRRATPVTRSAAAAEGVRGGLPTFPPGVDPALAASIAADIVEHSPKVLWEDIAGMADAKRLLKEAVVLPLLVPEFFVGVVQPWRGVLLFGPPGTGKTTLAKAVATSAKTTFFRMSAASLTDKHYGESEKLVRTLFQLARHWGPSTVFLDEIDALMSSRGGGGEHDASRRLKSEMLQQVDGLPGEEGSGRVMVLATTNRPWDLDEAMRRRLEKRIYIPLPDAEARGALLRHQLRGLKLAEDVDVERLVTSTEGYSGADVTLVVRDAAMMPMRRLIQAHSTEEIATLKEAGGLALTSVTQEDFENALRCIQPSVSPDSLKQFEDWYATYGSI